MSSWFFVVCFNCLLYYRYVLEVSANRCQTDLIAIMHDYITCWKIHHQALVVESFLKRVASSSCFHVHVYSFHLFFFGICSWLKLQFAFSNWGWEVLCAIVMPSCIKAVLWNVITVKLSEAYPSLNELIIWILNPLVISRLIIEPTSHPKNTVNGVNVKKINLTLVSID